MAALAAESADVTANIEQAQRCCRAQIVLKKTGRGAEIELYTLSWHIMKGEAPGLRFLKENSGRVHGHGSRPPPVFKVRKVQRMFAT